MKRPKLLKFLKENDCVFYKEGSNHTIFINKKTKKEQLSQDMLIFPKELHLKFANS
jgi:hypothetical protein